MFYHHHHHHHPSVCSSPPSLSNAPTTTFPQFDPSFPRLSLPPRLSAISPGIPNILLDLV
jgi:hypothetical protein